MQNYQDLLSEILIDEQTLQTRIAELGAQISADYADGNLLLICILRGGVPFLVDLSRNITVPHMMDFMAVSSYGTGKRESSGYARVTLDLQMNIRGKDVLLVEDIVDSGLTLAYIKALLEGRGPASLKICALIDKPERRERDVSVDYCGFHVQEGFLVGYGLDCNEEFRNLPDICILKE